MSSTLNRSKASVCGGRRYYCQFADWYQIASEMFMHLYILLTDLNSGQISFFFPQTADNRRHITSLSVKKKSLSE